MACSYNRFLDLKHLIQRDMRKLKCIESMLVRSLILPESVSNVKLHCPSNINTVKYVVIKNIPIRLIK